MFMGDLDMFLSQAQDILEHIREEDMDFAWSLHCGQKIMENLLFILVNLCFQSNLWDHGIQVKIIDDIHVQMV